MRRISVAALFAAPLLLLAGSGTTQANPNSCSAGFGCGGFCLNLFSGIHQHGPLYNYGPYYGYYPFKPYGPWDAYLRYDPFFYGDPYANWNANTRDAGNQYGRNQNVPYWHGLPRPSWPTFNLFNRGGCSSCSFHHASWLQGGWFRGHSWLHGSRHSVSQPACSSCGGVATATPTIANGDVMTRYSGVGNPAQSALFYSATPTLNPALEIVPTAGQTK
jgi:hypothetical protein